YGQAYAPPPTPGKRNRTAIIAAVIVVLVLIAGGITAFALTRGDNKSRANVQPTITGGGLGFGSGAPLGTGSAGDSAGASDSSLPTGHASPTGTGAAKNGPSVSSSQALAQRYFADANSHNTNDALTFICDEGKAEFQNQINDPDSDFTYTWSNEKFKRAFPQGNDVTVVEYQVTVAKDGDSNTADIDFLFINEGGTKLCGEKLS
ncbi:MAG: hypothetical protein JO147_08365, partial [Actinobacteria bacterium]|nr:hypothetical protein [Actinomycetota bacterium]